MAACTLLTVGATVCGITRYQPLHSSGQLCKVFVLSAVFTLTLVCGNVSLRHIPVSFNQAIGASTPFFTAGLAFLLQGRRESIATYVTLVPVVGGVVVAAGFEPSFHSLGFVACLVATSLRALKTVLQARSRCRLLPIRQQAESGSSLCNCVYRLCNCTPSIMAGQSG